MRMGRRLVPLVYLGIGLLGIGAFFDAGTLHGKYEIRSVGIRFVAKDELVFLLWYGLWGGLAAFGFGAALFGWLGGKVLKLFERVTAHPRELVAFISLFTFLSALLFRHAVLINEPIADDELVYQLTARNLALGRFTSTPPIDADFLRNQFVVVDEQRWHGKYPIGHSLLLAPFELFGRVDLLGPLLASGSVVLTFALGRRLIGTRCATVAVLMLACSPHFIWTHATLMSQVTSTFLALASVYASVRHGESRKRRWLAAMGGCLGFGILVRPMPSALIALVVLIDKLARTRSDERPFVRALREAGTWGPVFAVFIAVMLLANYAQSGSPWTSGYAEVHETYGMFQNINGELTNSVGAALVRENVWLFGWPWSLLLMPFARVSRERWLFWGVIGTGVAYRILVPKTVVATTGPIYMSELVPWLCLGSADGARTLVEMLGRLGYSDARKRVACGVIGAFITALLAFYPVQLRAIRRGSTARCAVRDDLIEAKAERALVFAEKLVFTGDFSTWAYYPPNPWPDLRDDVLFLRVPDGQRGLERAWMLWRERFADRPAFTFVPGGGGGGMLRPLDPNVVPTIGPPPRARRGAH